MRISVLSLFSEILKISRALGVLSLILGSLAVLNSKDASANIRLADTPKFKDIHSLPVPKLREIEKKLVKKLNNKKGDQTEISYKLAMLYSEIFRKKTADKYLVRQASQLAKQTIELDPKSHYGYVALSEVLFSMNLGPKALELLNQVKQVSLKNKNAIVLQELRIKSKNGKLTPVNLINFLKEHGDNLNLHRSSYETEVARELIVSIATHEQALDLFDYLAKSNMASPNLYAFGLSRHHASKKNLKAAQQALGGIDLNNMRIDDYVFLVEFALLDPIALKKTLPPKQKIMDFLDPFMKHNPEDEGYERRKLVGRLLYGLAAASTKFDDFKLTEEQVLNTYKKATQYNSDPVQGIKRLASLPPHIHRKLISKYFDWVSTAYPGSAKVYAAMADVWQNKIADHDAAIKGYLDAIVFEPKQSDHFIGLGISYYSKNEISKAKAVFSAALKINPSDALAAYNLACMHAITGEQEQAFAQLGIAFQLDPSLAKSAEQDPDLKSLRSTTRFQSLLQLTH